MCGFLFHNFKPETEIPKDLLSHRGPDNYTFCKYEESYFHHWRLSILDLSDAANQPIVSICKRYRMVYNGEIYNYKNLKLYLEKKYKHKFYTTSDTEVLFYGLIYEGKDFIRELNGMFSFIFHDNVENKITMVRDFFGIKPLFYHIESNRIIVSSEISPIHYLSKSSRRFNKDVQAELISCGFVYGKNTLYNGICKLEPGSIIEINLNGDLSHDNEYYYPNLPKIESNDFKTALIHSVKGQVISDVPVGVLNSGGIDSGLVSYFVGKVSEMKFKVNSYTAVFKDDFTLDESSYAKYVAKIADLRYSEVKIQSKELGKNLKKLIQFNREILLHPNSYNIYLLGKSASKNVKVLLSGEGSDELFQGYNLFRIIPLLRFRLFRELFALKSNHPYVNFKGTRNLIDTFKSKYSYISTNEQDTLTEKYPNISKSLIEREDLYKKCLKHYGFTKKGFSYLERKLYLPPLLDRQDRMLMASSVEGRVPFLDYYILSYLENNMRLKYSSLIKSKIPVTRLFKIIFKQKRKKFAFATPLKTYVTSLEKELDLANSFETYSSEININKNDLIDIYHSGTYQVKWILLNLMILCTLKID